MTSVSHPPSVGGIDGVLCGESRGWAPLCPISRVTERDHRLGPLAAGKSGKLSGVVLKKTKIINICCVPLAFLGAGSVCDAIVIAVSDLATKTLISFQIHFFKFLFRFLVWKGSM